MKSPKATRDRIVMDSGVLIALGDKDDKYHDCCVKWYEQERADLLLPVPIITEVGYHLGAKVGLQVEAAFLDLLGKDRRLKLCYPGRHDIRRMSAVMLKYAGLNLGTTDVSVIAIAEHFGATTIATVDRRDFSSITPIGGTHFDLVPDPLYET